jgi:hypothetical protein
MKTRAFTYLEEQLNEFNKNPLPPEITRELSKLEDIIIHNDSVALSQTLDVCFCELLHHCLTTSFSPADATTGWVIATRLFAYGLGNEIFNANILAKRLVSSRLNLTLTHYCNDLFQQCKRTAVDTPPGADLENHCLKIIKGAYREAEYIYSTYENSYACFFNALGFLATPLLATQSVSNSLWNKMLISIPLSATSFSLSTVVDRLEKARADQIPLPARNTL